VTKTASFIEWQFYPHSKKATPLAEEVVGAFKEVCTLISSYTCEHNSNKVLEVVRKRLEVLEFIVESGKRTGEKINVPVLFGRNGELEKCFDADAYHLKEGCP
jgi:hypothetical protein